MNCMHKLSHQLPVMLHVIFSVQGEKASVGRLYAEMLQVHSRITGDQFKTPLSVYTETIKSTLTPHFRNSPLLHITIRLHLTWRLLKFMQ